MSLKTLERETASNPQWTIIWLHGLGADGYDFVPIMRELVRPQWPGLRFVFPHAPMRAVTVNAGVALRAWYDIKDMSSLTTRADAEGVAQSVAEVSELIEAEIARGIPASQIMVAGFSQGGVIALETGIATPHSLAGVIALSTYLPRGEETFAQGRVPTHPIFMAHGTLDPVVSTDLGELARDQLRAAGAQVEWHSYPMQHAVCAEEVTDLATWVGARLGHNES